MEKWRDCSCSVIFGTGLKEMIKFTSRPALSLGKRLLVSESVWSKEPVWMLRRTGLCQESNADSSIVLPVAYDSAFWLRVLK
jgi:hypothetical protein